jgi:hypothetical protein
MGDIKKSTPLEVTYMTLRKAKLKTRFPTGIHFTSGGLDAIDNEKTTYHSVLLVIGLLAPLLAGPTFKAFRIPTDNSQPRHIPIDYAALSRASGFTFEQTGQLK